MEEEDFPTRCTCRVKLGIVQLRPQDVQESKDFEAKYKLVNQAIHFLGSCNIQEKCTIQDKINEVRKKIGRFYFDKDERLIAIPNQISMSKNETPRLISGKSEKNDKFYDKHYEDRLHQQLVIALKNKKAIALVLEGFQSENCLQPKIEKSRSVRGKDEFAEINCEEKELMEILEIPSIKKEDLALCVAKHKTLKFNLKEDDGESWLFKKVLQNENKNRLKIIPDENLENFYKYQWFECNLQEISMEWDSLVVLAEHKLVINIEVKSGSKLSVIKKAAKQTERHFLLFRRIFSAHLSEEWNFVKAAFAPNFEVSNQNEPCAYCKQFILTQGDIVNLQPWINHIIQQFVSPIKTLTNDEYQNLLVGIIGFTVTRNANMLTTLIHDPYELSQTMEKALTDQSSGIEGETPTDRNIIKKVVDGETSEYKHLCYMLSPEQINAIKSPASFLIIDGEYGTGKTFVLKERTMMFATKYPECKIAYINLSGMEDVDMDIPVLLKKKSSLMDFIARKDFEKFNNVDVVTFNDLVQLVLSSQIKPLITVFFGDRRVQTLTNDLIQSFLKYKNYDFIFIDESPLISLEPKCLSITIALRYSNNSNRKFRWKTRMIEEKKAVAITLQHNMRNTENILQLTKGFLLNSTFTEDNNHTNPESSEKNLVGPLCYHYKNVPKLDDISLGKAVINKYFSNNPDETVVFLCSAEYKYIMFKELQKSFFNTHRIINMTNDSSEIESYLRDPTGILLADLNSFQGAQARNTVIFLITIVSKDYDYNIIKNALMRTMSFTIFISFETLEYYPVLGVSEDLDLHEYIHANSSKPICHYIEIDPEFDAKNMADQIFDRLVISEGTVLFFVRYSEDAERIRNVLYKKFTAKKEIVIVTYPNKQCDHEKYIHLLTKHLEMKDRIVIIRFKPFGNNSILDEDKNNYLKIEDALLISSLARYVIILESGKNQIENESYCLRNLCLNIKSKIVVVATAGFMDLYKPFFEMVNISETTPEQ